MSRLEVVKEREVTPETLNAQAHEQAAAAAQAHQVATKMLLMAIGALGQRFVVALSNIFTLATFATAFYLWMIALPTLDVMKIVGLSIYSVFVLAINIYGRRK